MKIRLAQALNSRARLRENMVDLKNRITNNLLVQEGDTPAEQPRDLLELYERCAYEYYRLAADINNANINIRTEYDGVEMSLMEMITLRDRYQTIHKMYKAAADGLVPSIPRFGRNEIKFVQSMNPDSCRALANRYAKCVREIDDKIQMMNWVTDIDVRIENDYDE